MNVGRRVSHLCSVASLAETPTLTIFDFRVQQYNTRRPFASEVVGQ